MALDVKVGVFNKPTSIGSQSITGVGFQPKALIVFATHVTADGTPRSWWRQFVGVATASDERSFAESTAKPDTVHQEPIAGIGIWGDPDPTPPSRIFNAFKVEEGSFRTSDTDTAQLTSFDSDGFTLEWTTDSTMVNEAWRINYIALGGDSLEAVKAFEWRLPTTIGSNVSKSVTGVGFQPDTLINFYIGWLGGGNGYASFDNFNSGHVGMGVVDADLNEWAMHAGSVEHNTGLPANTNTARAQKTGASIYALEIDRDAADRYIWAEASLTSFDADGFTYNFVTNLTNNEPRVFTLALKGAIIKAGSFTKKTSIGSQQITGVGITPKGLLLASFMNPAISTIIDHARLALGASDGTTERSASWTDSHAAAYDNMDSLSDAKIFQKADNSTQTVDAEAELSSFDSDGFTLNWLTNDTDADQLLYLALGGEVSAQQEDDMAGFTTVSNELVSILEGISALQEVHNYEKSAFRGYPAVTVVPSENESDFEATQERQRVLAFRLRFYVEVISDRQEVTGEGLKEADRIMRTVLDDVIDEFDKPANARLSGNADTAAKKVLYVEPVPSSWEYDSDRKMRMAEILLRVHVYVATYSL